MEVEPNIYGEDTLDTRKLLSTTFAPISNVLKVLIEKITNVLADNREKCVLFTLPRINKHCIEIFMYQMILDIKQENHIFPASAYMPGNGQETCPMGKDSKHCDACNKIISQPDNQLMWLNTNMQSMLDDVSDVDSFEYVPLCVSLFSAWLSICHLINADVYNQNYATAFKSIYTYASNETTSFTQQDKRKRGRPKKQDNVGVQSIPFVDSTVVNPKTLCEQAAGSVELPDCNKDSSSDDAIDVTKDWTEEMFQDFDDLCHSLLDCTENS